MDEKFGKFVEVIQKLYVNIPQLDAIQVPRYAKYIRDILTRREHCPPLWLSCWQKNVVRPSSIYHQGRRKIPDVPLLIAQSETNT